ncbi:uncharacterized protein METZ01_LOCUS173968 [marine metagenome]|uniref:Uncharacterized protein n=1 Tax=marine metagenome TaxID=408172 RepID=A0A382C5G0_9ZZZZ
MIKDWCVGLFLSSDRRSSYCLTSGSCIGRISLNKRSSTLFAESLIV